MGNPYRGIAGKEGADVLATILRRFNREGPMRAAVAAFERDSGRKLTADFIKRAERIAVSMRAVAGAMFATTDGPPREVRL